MTFLWAIVLLGVLIFVHEFGHFLFAKLMRVRVLKFSLGFGPRLAGIRKGETEYQVSALPLGGYVKMLGEEPGEELTPEEKKHAFAGQPVWKRGLIVLAGPGFNFLLTFLIFCFFLSSGHPLTIPRLSADIAPVVGQVVPGTPAAAAGLRPGDRIVEVQGNAINTWFDLIDIVGQRPGQNLDFKIKRDGAVLDMKITPEAHKEKTAEGKEITIGRIGIQRAGTSVPFYLIEARKNKVLSVPAGAASATYRFSSLILQVMGGIVTGDFSIKSIGGPITIVQRSGEAAELGFISYLIFMAFISANLAVLNLLPIPILDGGHLLFLVLEKIKGKPLKETTQALLQRAGLLILVIIMAFALQNDIMRLIRKG
jgi:regulator of sigma E protease